MTIVAHFFAAVFAVLGVISLALLVYVAAGHLRWRWEQRRKWQRYMEELSDEFERGSP